MSEKAEQLHILAKITGYYGVKGWLKLYSFTEPRDNIIHYPALKIRRNKREGWQDIKLDSGKAHGKGVIAHFTGYDNREIAASLIGAELAVYRSDFKPAGKDEYYWSDLIGMTVKNLEGIELGQVTRLMETAANDVLVINTNSSSQISASQDSASQKSSEEILIPFVLDHFIEQVDLDAGTITVDWPVDWNSD